MQTLDYIRVVLVQPTHAGNIGATARAMGNMGVNDLRLVKPRDFPSPVASARAAGADWVLERAVVCEHLSEAVHDCSLVIGTTARSRSIEWPQQSPEVAMQHAALHAGAAPVALVFGRESRGLSNQELDVCNYLVQIPVEESFSSLNLASAVLILLYELRTAIFRDEMPEMMADDIQAQRASAQQMQYFYDHLTRVLVNIDFSKGGSTKLHRKLRRLFNRAWPTEQEVRILRGMLSAIDEKTTSSPSR